MLAHTRAPSYDLIKPLSYEFVVCSVFLEFCETSVELVEELCVAFLNSESELFVVTELVAYELSDVAVRIEISLANRLVYDDALNVSVLELHVAVCPLVENYAVSDFALFLHLLDLIAACCSDLAGKLHVRCNCVDACEVGV